MTSIRLRPAGFDARPGRPSSLRAQARRVYRTKSKELVGEIQNDAARGDEQVTALTLQVRALYEDSVVPVAEIARIAGVSERTLYKYVAKGGWRRRHGTQDIASAVRKRAAKRKPRPCVTLKGAGGRFIRTADADAPVRRGLKALDPAGEASVLARAGQAAALSAEAVARTRRRREATSGVRMLALLTGMARDLAAVEDAEAREAGPEGDREAQPQRPGCKPWRPMPGSE